MVASDLLRTVMIVRALDICRHKGTRVHVNYAVPFMNKYFLLLTLTLRPVNNATSIILFKSPLYFSTFVI